MTITWITEVNPLNILSFFSYNIPSTTFNGFDAQLDAAINHLKKLIPEESREVPDPPPYPDKSFDNK